MNGVPSLTRGPGRGVTSRSRGRTASSPAVDLGGGTWVDIPRPELTGGDVSVWTGHSLITWGAMAVASQVDRAHMPPSATVGLQLGPS